MPNHDLPQRDPFIGPPARYVGASSDVVELFADAVRVWAAQIAPTESSLCRGVDSPGIGRASGEVK
ncbi:hypothetical protein ACIHDR_26930 [Nocardia sp. NPDC052278]|uniref:hypothetical protein n=1 Tax=unclassified Nocardia TaxID=2637762 RepID=UPI0036D09C93